MSKPLNVRNPEEEITFLVNANWPAMWKLFVSLWNSEQDMFTNASLTSAIQRNANIPKQWLDRWEKDYQTFIADSLQNYWTSALVKGGDNISGGIINMFGAAPFRVSLPGLYAQQWIVDQMGSHLDAFTLTQFKSTQYILAEYGLRLGYNVYDLAKYLQNTVGLNERQTLALAKYSDSLSRNLTSPLSTRQQEQIQKKIDKYRQQLLRARAFMIAQTELAGAYSNGQIDAFKEYKKKGWLPNDLIYKKEWVTVPDERLCPRCRALDRMSADMEGAFSVEKFANLFPLTPPAHPRCRCSINIIAIERDSI